MVFRSRLVAAVCSAAFLLSGAVQAGNLNTLKAKDELCSLVPNSYAGAKQANPEISFAIDELSKHSIATWYSDRNGDYESVARRLVTTCPDSSRLSVVVYGLPNKDCEAGYSSGGSTVQSAADYVVFLQKLMDIVKDRKVLYVLEPDAVGLLAKEGGCGEAAGYRDNLKTAIQMLSTNPNAEIYLDVGYWSLGYPEPRQRVVEVIKNLISGGGVVKGITLNTSNYRKTDEIVDLCSKFQSDMGSAAQMNCIIDTSRNYRGSPSTEWCNVGSAGIGQPPTANTGLSNIDYMLWIKPAGESDGTCDGSGHTQDATRGPPAGQFFVEGFKKLWDYGYFVDAKHMPSFDGSAPAPTPDQTSFYQTGAPIPSEPATVVPSTPAPEITTSTPVTSAPETTTATPSTSTPDVTTSTPSTSTPVTSTPVTSTPEATTSTPSTSTPVTSTPETTTSTPSTSTPVTSTPETTTSTPSTSVPETTTSTPTTSAPGTTTPAPQATTSIPSSTPTSTTPSPVVGSTPSPIVTPAPESTTKTPSSGLTDAPSTTPSVDEPTPTPSFRHTKLPKTKAPKTEEPTETPSPTDFVQNATPKVDGGPQTIAGNPNTANTKSSNGGSSATGGIIAAILIAAVACAVAAAIFVHIRRRAQDAAADEMKTPVSMEPAHPAYLSQL